jgi:hypothetical protein
MLASWLALLSIPGAELQAPFVVEAGGRVIDVTGGNSAPAWADLTGDGVPDLLVGQFDQGRVRLYRNVGARGAPRFVDFELLRAGQGFVDVPYG